MIIKTRKDLTAKDYDHYAKCQLPLKDCNLCLLVWGNKTEIEVLEL